MGKLEGFFDASSSYAKKMRNEVGMCTNEGYFSIPFHDPHGLRQETPQQYRLRFYDFPVESSLLQVDDLFILPSAGRLLIQGGQLLEEAWLKAGTA